MAREFFKNLPDTTTPLNAPRLNNFLNGNEAMGSIVVDDITCKNLADIDDFIVDGIGNTPALVGAKYIYNLKPNTTYTLSFIKARISGVSIGNTTIYDVSKIDFYNGSTKLSTVSGTTAGLASGASKSFSKTITTPDNCDNIGVVFFNNNGDTNANTKVSKVQLEPGSVATDYVEHKEYANDFSNLLQCVYKKTIWGNVLTNTGISVNGGAGGRTYLVCWSTHSSTGDSTTSYIGMLRCGYNGNNYSLIEIARSTGSTSSLLVTFSIDDNGNLQYQNSNTGGASRVYIYQLT